MAIINKISFVCGGSSPTEFAIGLADTNDAGINAILATIPSSYGTYTYSHTVNGGSVTSQLTANEASGCQATLFKDNVGYSTSGSCCAAIEPSSLLSTDAGNLLTIGLDGRIYFNGSVGVDIYVDGATINPLNFELTLTDNSGTTPNVVLPLNILRQTTAPIVVQGISYASGTDFQTILDALVDCCPAVNTTPLATIIDPNVAQTTNFNEYVTDSNGNKFYIDNDGTATKITTDFSLTVNAGTTSVATDDSLGTATVGNGGIIHLWSSDGSIQFGVVQGSAETGVTTNSNIIPFTASAPVDNDAGLSSTNVQSAIDEVDSKVEVLEDRKRAWAKTGDVQSTNSEDVLVTDSILHEGKVNIGADEATMPFSSEYSNQVFNNLRIFETTRSKRIFNDNNIFTASNGDIIHIDWVNGIDGLEPHSYLNSTFGMAGTPATVTTPAFGFMFKTLEAASDWINTCDSGHIQCRIINTTVGNPLTISKDIYIWDKKEISFVSFPFTSNCYVDLGFFVFSAFGSIVSLNRINLNLRINEALKVNDRAQLALARCNVTIASSVSSIIQLANGSVLFDRLTNINFSANNQTLCHASGGGSDCSVIITDHTPAPTFIVGTFTGIKLNSFTVKLQIPSNIFIPSTLAAIDTSNAIIDISGSEALKVKTVDVLLNNYAQNLGSTKPTRWTDLNATSANLTGTSLATVGINELGEQGVIKISWTTALRPTVIGSDGFNTTLGVREYLNGSSAWVQY